MRELTSLKNEVEAQRLAAYLAVQAIESSLDREGPGEWTIWIRNDDDRERAREILQEYEQNPTDPKYASAERKVRSVIREAERIQKENNEKADRFRKRQSGSWWYCYPSTYIIIAICVFVALVCTSWMKGEATGMGIPVLCNSDESVLFRKLGVVSPVRVEERDDKPVAYYYVIPEFPDEGLDFNTILNVLEGKAVVTWESLKLTMSKGEFWRPVTPIFIHLDVLHILMNLLLFRAVGGLIEYVRGTKRFVCLCIALAVTSNLAQLFWSGPAFGGISGVVLGLVGYAWVKGETQPSLGLSLPQHTLVFCVIFMFACITGLVGSVANAAHVVGFVGGLLIGGRQYLWKRMLFWKK